MGNENSSEQPPAPARKGSIFSPGKGKDKSHKVKSPGKMSKKDLAMSQQHLPEDNSGIPVLDKKVEDAAAAVCKKRSDSPDGYEGIDANKLHVEHGPNDESGYASDSFLLTDHEASHDFLAHSDADNLEEKDGKTGDAAKETVITTPDLMSDVAKVMSTYLNDEDAGSSSIRKGEVTDTGQPTGESDNHMQPHQENTENTKISCHPESEQDSMSTGPDQANQLIHDPDSVQGSVSCDQIGSEGVTNQENSTTGESDNQIQPHQENTENTKISCHPESKQDSMSTGPDQANQLIHDPDSVEGSVPCDQIGVTTQENSNNTQQDTIHDTIHDDSGVIIHSKTTNALSPSDYASQDQNAGEKVENLNTGDINTSDNTFTDTHSERKMEETNEHQTHEININTEPPPETLQQDDQLESPSRDTVTDQICHNDENVVDQVTQEQEELPEPGGQDARSRPEENYTRPPAESHIEVPPSGVDSHASQSSGSDVCATDAADIRKDANDESPAAEASTSPSEAKCDSPQMQANEANTVPQVDVKEDKSELSNVKQSNIEAQSIAENVKDGKEFNESQNTAHETNVSQDAAQESNVQQKDVTDSVDTNISSQNVDDSNAAKSQDNVTPSLIVTSASVEEPDGGQYGGQPVKLEASVDSHNQILSPEASQEKPQFVSGVVMRRSKRPTGNRHTSILHGQGQVAKAVAALVDEKEEEDNKNRKSVFKDDVLDGDITNINAIVEEETGNTKLHIAASEFKAESVKDCLKSGANVNKVNREYRTALHELVLSYVFSEAYDQALNHKNFYEIVQALSKAQLDMNQTDLRGNTALHYVVRLKYQQETIKELLTFGCRINIGDNKRQTSLHVAVMKGDYETVQTLIDHGGDANQRDAMGQSSLHLAAMGQHHAEIIDLLVKNGANVELVDRGNRTPLHFAAKSGRLENVEALLRHGASVFALEGSGQTPLHLAAAKDPTEKVVDLLLKSVHSRDLDRYLNLQDPLYGDTALHKAVRFRKLGNVKTLCQYDPDPNIPNYNRETPAHLAASYPDIIMWTTLANIGANFHMPDNNGMTVLKLAQRKNNAIIVTTAANLQERNKYMVEYT